MFYAYAGLIALSAFAAAMTVFGAWAAYELRKRWREYVL